MSDPGKAVRVRYDWSFDIIGNWDSKYGDRHWLAVTTVLTKFPYPIWEIHLWVANYDLRLMWWRAK